MKEAYSRYGVLKEAFDMIDIDNSGEVDAREITDLMQSLGKSMDSAVLEAFLTGGDQNHDRLVDFVEFVALEDTLPGSISNQIAEFKQLFKLFDTDGGGTLGASEIQSAMRLMGEVISEEEAVTMCRVEGVESQGQLTLPGFVYMLVGRSGGGNTEVMTHNAPNRKPKYNPTARYLVENCGVSRRYLSV